MLDVIWISWSLCEYRSPVCVSSIQEDQEVSIRFRFTFLMIKSVTPWPFGKPCGWWLKYEVFSFCLFSEHYNVVCVIQKTTLCTKLHPHAALLDLHPEICVCIYKRRYTVCQWRHRPLHAIYGELVHSEWFWFWWFWVLRNLPQLCRNCMQDVVACRLRYHRFTHFS